MKRTLHKLRTPALAAAMFALPCAVWAQGWETTQDKFTVSDLQTDNYGKYLTVSLNGQEERIYCTFNLTMTLPIGMSFKTDGGKVDLYMNEATPFFPYTSGRNGRQYSHKIEGNTPSSPDVAKIICSSTNVDFVETSGDLFDIYVSYNAWTKAGENTVEMTGLNLTTKEAVKYVPEGDINTGIINIPAEGREVSINIAAENQIGTCILPFSYTTPDGVTAYKPMGNNGSAVLLQAVETMEAYKPYILYAPAGYTGTWTGTANASDFPGTPVVEEGGLCGVLVQTEVKEGYILQNQPEHGTMFYAIDDVPFSLKPGRCYYSAATPSNARLQFAVETEDGIAPLTAAPASAEWYNLNGQRIAAPAQHGIYIYKGKKILK